MGLGKAKILSQGAAGGIVGTDHFDTVLWTGNATTRTIPVNFQPDFTWIKARTFSSSHGLYDSVRGAQKWMSSAFTSVSQDSPSALQSFIPAGFTLGTDSGQYGVNASGVDYVAWNWYAPTSESIGASGSRIASTVKKNVDAGFSVVGYTAGSSTSQSIGHGLGVSPKLVLIKKTSATENWIVWYEGAGTTNFLELNQSSSTQTGAGWGGVPTTEVVHLQDNDASRSSGNGASYVAYCFADIAGYQRISTYTGTGNAGLVVDVGFTPSFLLVKRIDSGGQAGARGWFLLDNKRNTSNPRNTSLEAQDTYQDNTLSSISFDFDATSFKVNGTNYQVNQSGGSYLYLAIA